MLERIQNIDKKKVFTTIQMFFVGAAAVYGVLPDVFPGFIDDAFFATASTMIAYILQRLK